MIAAVPVASSEGAARLSRVCDEFHALAIDPRFEAVGQYYDSFPQTTDEQVLAALRLRHSDAPPNKTIAHAQQKEYQFWTSPIVTPVTRMEPEWIASTSLNSRF